MSLKQRLRPILTTIFRNSRKAAPTGGDAFLSEFITAEDMHPPLPKNQYPALVEMSDIFSKDILSLVLACMSNQFV